MNEEDWIKLNQLLVLFAEQEMDQHAAWELETVFGPIYINIGMNKLQEQYDKVIPKDA